jgi:hypothetical protein
MGYRDDHGTKAQEQASRRADFLISASRLTSVGKDSGGSPDTAS